MSYVNKINTIIHDISTIDLNEYVYHEIVALTSATLVINDESVSVSPNTRLQVVVKTISGPANSAVLLGSPINVYQGSTKL